MIRAERGPNTFQINPPKDCFQNPSYNILWFHSFFLLLVFRLPPLDTLFNFSLHSSCHLFAVLNFRFWKFLCQLKHNYCLYCIFPLSLFDFLEEWKSFSKFYIISLLHDLILKFSLLILLPSYVVFHVNYLLLNSNVVGFVCESKQKKRVISVVQNVFCSFLCKIGIELRKKK